jgi:hypothetical protein
MPVVLGCFIFVLNNVSCIEGIQVFSLFYTIVVDLYYSEDIRKTIWFLCYVNLNWLASLVAV